MAGDSPNFGLSGLLARERNAVGGAVAKYTIPNDSSSHDNKWRLYCFKGDSQTSIYRLEDKEYFVIGKDTRIADIRLDHPSCSRQHAVIQFRQHLETVRPYLIDLDSTNGTLLNGNRIPGSRYVELTSQDLIRFGSSSREYVMIHEDAAQILKI